MNFENQISKFLKNPHIVRFKLVESFYKGSFLATDANANERNFSKVYIGTIISSQLYSKRNTYTKIGTIQRRLAWPLRKDDTQNREAFHIFAAARLW